MLFRSNGNAVNEALDDIEIGGTSQNAVAMKLKTFENLIVDGLKLVRRPAKPNHPTAWQLVGVDADVDPLAYLM